MGQIVSADELATIEKLGDCRGWAQPDNAAGARTCQPAATPKTSSASKVPWRLLSSNIAADWKLRAPNMAAVSRGACPGLGQPRPDLRPRSALQAGPRPSRKHRFPVPGRLAPPKLAFLDRKSTRLNSSHVSASRMPSS